MGYVEKNSKNEYVLKKDYLIHKVNLRTKDSEHTHGFVELVYTLEGHGIHIIDGREYRVKSGDVLLINYGSRHTVIPVENLSYVDIMLKPEYVNAALKDTEDIFLILQLRDFSDLSNSVIRDNVFLHFDHHERKKLEFLLEITENEQNNTLPASNTVVYSALSIILTLVFRKMSENTGHRLSVNEHLLGYIERNCHESISVKEIADMCGYTPEHFSRMFRAYTKKTPKEYILEARLKRAEHLLKSSDKPIELIIEESGFSNRTEFFKRFSERNNVTPLQYRKNQK